MKKMCVLALSVIPTFAFADNNINDNWRFYLRADAGITYADFMVDDYDLGGFQGMFNFAGGAQKGRWRAELNYQERATISEMFSSLLTQTTASMEQHGFLANGYYDVLSFKHFAWYVGAGAGVNNYEKIISYNNTGKEKIENGYSMMLGAYTGASINFEHIGIDLGVDYYYTYKLNQHALTPKIGLRVIF